MSAVFTQKGHLNSHIAGVHKGKKLFECKICDAKFARRDSLNKHFDSVHEDKKPF